MSDKTENPFLKKDIYFMGRNLNEIPCFRNSFLYGISTGLGVGFGTFLLTSNGFRSFKYGFGSYLGMTWLYWGYCRYSYNKVERDLKEIRKAIHEKVDDSTNDPVVISASDIKQA
uniref:Cytochrome c oxidase assembly protein COX20, mitochondrial n=1 Tax=Cacopsylla melanoneura TaxID=428564 RepID=A0A8D8TEI3_9HEMI